MNNSEKMLLALDKQDLEAADRYFNAALEQDDEESLLDLASYLEAIGFLSQAKIAYEQLADAYPELRLNLAQIAHEDGLIEQAFAYLEEITSDMPEYVEALLIKADLYQSEGLADVAYEKLLEAKSLSDDPIIVFALAEIEMELGKFQEAVKNYAQLDNRTYKHLTGVSTYQRIGLAYASLGKFEVAVEFLEKSIELDYDDQTVFELAAILYEQEAYQRANVYFKQLDTLSPDFEGYELVYAQSLHAEHRPAEALSVIKKGLSKNDLDTNLLLLASRYSYELHDQVAAEQYLLKAKEEAEDLDEIVLRLTSLYLEQERFDEVVALYDEELESVLALWNIAKAYQAMEKDQEALNLFENLLRDLVDNPEFLADYIETLRREGDLIRAREYAGRYLVMVPDDLVMQEFYNPE